MIVTQRDARRILSAMFPETPVKLTTKCTVIVRPVFDPRPSVAISKIAPGKDSAVRIGQLLSGGQIDWTAEFSA